MKKRSPFFALLWLLLIPFALAAGLLLVRLGACIDLHILYSGGTAQGHGMPVFTVLFSAASFIASIAVVTTSIILTVNMFRSRLKENGPDEYLKQKSVSDYHKPTDDRSGIHSGDGTAQGDDHGFK